MSFRGCSYAEEVLLASDEDPTVEKCRRGMDPFPQLRSGQFLVGSAQLGDGGDALDAGQVKPVTDEAG